MPVAEIANRAEVAKLHQGVGRSLKEHKPRALLQCALNIFRVGCIDVGKCKSKVRKHLIEQARRPTVEIMACDNVIARLKHASDSVDRGHPTAEHLGGNSAFERGKVSLQPIARWIRHARVFVTFVLSDFFLNVRGSRVDWDSDSTGQRVGLLSGVNGASCEAGIFRGQVFSWEWFGSNTEC